MGAATPGEAGEAGGALVVDGGAAGAGVVVRVVDALGRAVGVDALEPAVLAVAVRVGTG